jgi:Zn-dependent peptidase ImmA (M78 family)
VGLAPKAPKKRETNRRKGRKEYDPYMHAEELGIEVIHRPILKANGYWIPDHKLIVIRSGMSQVWDRSTVAHEVAHATLKHRDDRAPHEMMADMHAAENMICPTQFETVIQRSPDSVQLAGELGVTGRLLRAYLLALRLAG